MFNNRETHTQISDFRWTVGFTRGNGGSFDLDTTYIPSRIFVRNCCLALE